MIETKRNRRAGRIPSSRSSRAFRMNSERRRYHLTVFITLAVLASVLTFLPWKGSGASAQIQKAPAQEAFRLRETAARQIQALLQEKESRTAAQQRIDCHLLQELKMSRSEPVADGIERLETGIAPDADGLFLVDIKANVSRSLLARISRMGAEIINSFENDIRARVPLVQLE